MSFLKGINGNVQKIFKYIRNPKKIILFLASKGIIYYDDKKYIRERYYERLNKIPDLVNPSTFNEKLQWLKLYNRNPEYIQMVDKYEVKEYIAQIIGKEYIIPTLGVWDKVEDINFDELPNQFVIKCTHNSGGLVICRDKSKLDSKKIKEKIEKSLRRNYYYAGREWPYKNVKKRIIVEKYMEDKYGNDLKDYKLFCFNGEAKYILVCSNRQGSFKNTDFFDINWKLMPFTRENHTNNPNGIDRPKNLEKMVEIANKLSKDIPFVRVDLYEINDKVYFGELTFFPSSGFEGFNPKEWDKKLGDMLELPKEKIEGKNEK